MGKALGITQQRIHQLIDEGVVIRDETSSSGAVKVIDSIKNYYKVKSHSEVPEEVDLMVERARHEKAKREIAELKLAKLQGSAYDAKTVELVMTEMASNLRTQLLGLPSKLAPILENRKKEEIYEILTKEIEEKLSELSAYSPDLFMGEDADTAEGGDSDEEC
ncbi:hypothetical protein [Acidaminococcus sp.]|uniref:hypothetical protein n=1 Tax=Acidaminococcus sp. TaxID=1872103 RepID=UPI003D7C52A0